MIYKAVLLVFFCMGAGSRSEKGRRDTGKKVAAGAKTGGGAEHAPRLRRRRLTELRARGDRICEPKKWYILEYRVLFSNFNGRHRLHILIQKY